MVGVGQFGWCHNRSKSRIRVKIISRIHSPQQSFIHFNFAFNIIWIFITLWWPRTSVLCFTSYPCFFFSPILASSLLPWPLASSHAALRVLFLTHPPCMLSLGHKTNSRALHFSSSNSLLLNVSTHPRAKSCSVVTRIYLFVSSSL